MNSRVKNTKTLFTNEFGVDLELYYGSFIAPDYATLADLRDKKIDKKTLRPSKK